jgi:hypothetical protein
MTVPIEKFGKDHWSTFAYIETRIVDHDGFISVPHMRGHLPGWEKYPTRLKGGEEISPHSDFDCVDDLMAAGLLEGGRATHYRYSLTRNGQAVASALREHKGLGKNFASFEPPWSALHIGVFSPSGGA